MPQEVIAVFDVGKTNKKFFLFDRSFKVVHQTYIRFDEIPDDDGFHSEDLYALANWIKQTFEEIISNQSYSVKAVNFSAYGASLVHLDVKNELATPFYNYLKPLPRTIEDKFLGHFKSKEDFELRTASPYLGMLNSGIQLIYLKYAKPNLFQQVERTIHFPQYLSGIITGEFMTDYMSIGCHTGLWDFGNNDYSHWLTAEGVQSKLCQLKSDAFKMVSGVKVGRGIHDSSAALMPYLSEHMDPFVLISTGTWNISMNPFNHEPLNSAELKLDCLNYMTSTGKSVKSTRLFLGNHLRETVKKLAEFFNVDYEDYKQIGWKPERVNKCDSSRQLLFDHKVLLPERFGFTNSEQSNFSMFPSFELAVHQLFEELTDLQVASLHVVLGDVKDIFVDGGFATSDLFLSLLAKKLPEHRIYSCEFGMGSALGAALQVSEHGLPEDYFKDHYKVKLWGTQ
ncbi:MAG: sugar kinase [Cyclobacteriaceae bacterium]